MIFRILGLFSRNRQTAYERGYEYAWERLTTYGKSEIEELEAQALGTFNRSEEEHEFDSGILEAIGEYEAENIRTPATKL